MEEKTALIFGATGIVGGNLIDHLLRSDKAHWKIIGVSTTEPNFWPWWGDKRVSFVSVNLFDENCCREKFSQHPDIKNVGYISYAAYKQSNDNNQMIDDNMKMFKNALTVLEFAKQVKRVHLNTGSKYYGAFSGPYKTPAEESDERPQTPFFYYLQEDYLRDLQKGKSWSYLVTRPPEIGGYSKGYMNLAQSIAVYATFCHEFNLKFKCPGNTTSWNCVMDVADIEQLCSFIEEGVLSDNSKYKNEAFNLNNGDVFRWIYLWPKLADYFKLEYEEPTAKGFYLKDHYSEKKQEWKQIAQKYNLRWDDLGKVATFDFADLCIGREWDSMLSMSKAREAGFKGYKSTEKMYTDLFDCFRKSKIIPTW
jgi:nucleoside-diphosphate-sugar epimerase